LVVLIYKENRKLYYTNGLGLTASKAFCVIILCNNENHACDKIKFRMKIATHKIGTHGCQAAAAVISSQGDAAKQFRKYEFVTHRFSHYHLYC
jgi:hypothetical protein